MRRYQPVDLGAEHYAGALPFRVIDGRDGQVVRNARGFVRRFRTRLAAARHADALNRGCKRAAGMRP